MPAAGVGSVLGEEHELEIEVESALAGVLLEEYAGPEQGYVGWEFEGYVGVGLGHVEFGLVRDVGAGHCEALLEGLD